MTDWISVSKALPQESGEYLATLWSGCVIILNYSTEHKVFNTYFDSDVPVIAWMPLPEPYKEELND